MPKFIEFTIDGVDPESDPQASYKLCYDFNLLCDAEEATGYNLLLALRNLAAMSAGQMRAVLFALLRTAHPHVTVKEAGSLITCDGLAVTEAIWEALDAIAGDDVLFRQLSRMATERPVALIELLARIKVPETETAHG